MKERFALAYSGSLASSAAVAWLMERHGADVVTVTVDVGQTGDLEEVRARALACGARRAHVIDARDAFARDYVMPALRSGEAATAASLLRLADPLIAKKLAEIAAIEGADAVAHAASPDSTLQAWLSRIDASLRVVAPAQEWGMDAERLSDYARARSLPGTVRRQAPHLLLRRAVDPALAPEAEAHLDIAFERGVPAMLNDVQMTLAELIESLSLIAGQYGLGYRDAVSAPAAVVLRAAFAAMDGADDVVRLALTRGTYTLDKRSPVGSAL
jgi:argininosuccinate synthase